MSLHLERLALREIRLPLREPVRGPAGAVQVRRILLLELHDRSGATAWSECVAREQPDCSPETIDTAWLMIESQVAPRLLGRRFAHPVQVHPLLEEGFRGHPMAKAAVEMGMWGLAAAAGGQPLARLLGGTRTAVATGICLGTHDAADQIVSRALAAAGAGYRRVKLKIAPGRDLDCLRAVREALGPEASLSADANGSYTPADAERLAALDGLGLAMIEQPLAWDDLVRHAELQRRLQTPICLDESIGSLARAQDMVALGSGRVLNLKPGRVGGLGPSLAIHDFCRAHGVPVWCGEMLESGVGRAYNVALASLPGFTLPGELSPSARYWERDLVTPEWTMEEGMVRVPLDRPGIGVVVDDERVAALTLRSTVLAP